MESLKSQTGFTLLFGWPKLGVANRGHGPRNPRQVFEVAQSSHRRVFRGDAVQSAQFVVQNTDNDGILVRFEMTLSVAESALLVDIKIPCQCLHTSLG